MKAPRGHFSIVTWSYTVGAAGRVMTVSDQEQIYHRTKVNAADFDQLPLLISGAARREATIGRQPPGPPTRHLVIRVVQDTAAGHEIIWRNASLALLEPVLHNLATARVWLEADPESGDPDLLDHLRRLQRECLVKVAQAAENACQLQFVTEQVGVCDDPSTRADNHTADRLAVASLVADVTSRLLEVGTIPAFWR